MLAFRGAVAMTTSISREDYLTASRLVREAVPDRIHSQFRPNQERLADRLEQAACMPNCPESRRLLSGLRMVLYVTLPPHW
jgi:hypothetical protein